MNNARNWYMYFTTAFSLQGLTWGVIGLIRILFLGDVINKSALALQLSIIIIALPAYLIHWLWAQRLAARDAEERISIQRQLYLFGVLAGSLAPGINDIFQFFNQGFVQGRSHAFLFNGIPIIVLAIVFIYHLVVQKESQIDLEVDERNLLLRCIYILGFSLTGLVMTSYGAIGSMAFLFESLKGAYFGAVYGIGSEIIRLLIGIGLWSIFWSWNQKSNQKYQDDQTVFIQWVFLYIIVFVSTIVTVSCTIMITDSVISKHLMRLFDDNGNILVLPTMIVMAVLWFYHGYVLQSDMAKRDVSQKQEKIKWLYHYLVAGIGFSTLVIGLAGLIHIFLRVIGNQLVFSEDPKADLSLYSSMVIVGLPTWLLAWSRIRSRMQKEEGLEERASSIRRFYLYIFIFAGTLTGIHGLIYIVYQFLIRVIGEKQFSSLFIDTVLLIANIVVAVLVLGYHWSILKMDNKLIGKVTTSELSVLKVVIFDVADGIGNPVKTSLTNEFPDINFSLIVPTDDSGQKEEDLKDISTADFILIPMSFLSESNQIYWDYMQFAYSSSAKKILAPQSMDGFEWVGVRIFEGENLSRQITKVFRRVLKGEIDISEKPIGCLAIGGIIVSVFILLIVVVGGLLLFLSF